jgi:glycine/D-amino acid oxidase-like deaminating enzyme
MGTVKAINVVNATNAWIGHLYPEFRGKIFPTRGQIIHVDGMSLNVEPMDWNYGGEYLIQRPDMSLIFGGGRRFAPRTRSIILDLTQGGEIGNADDTSIDCAVSRYLKTFLPSQLPLIEPVTPIREWTGIMGFSDDTHPYVGHSQQEPNKWIIGGFQGQGMPRIWLCAEALAQQLLSGASTWPAWMPKAYVYSSDSRNVEYFMQGEERGR